MKANLEEKKKEKKKKKKTCILSSEGPIFFFLWYGVCVAVKRTLNKQGLRAHKKSQNNVIFYWTIPNTCKLLFKKLRYYQVPLIKVRNRFDRKP